MSSLKRATISKGPPKRDVFASLRETQIVNLKPLLPAGKCEYILVFARGLTDARDSLDNS